MLHIVSASASQQGITLGQVAVDSKSNEITVIPDLLKMLEFHGAIRWVASGRSPPKSSRAVVIMCWRSKELSPRCKRRSPILSLPKTKTKAFRHTTREKSRGRLETRHYTILPLPDSMSSIGQMWSKLISTGRVVREVDHDERRVIIPVVSTRK